MFLKPAWETLRANSFAFSFELKAPSWISQYVPGARLAGLFEFAEVLLFDEEPPLSFAIIFEALAAVC